MNYSQWILNRHWEINTNCFVLSAFTQKTVFVLLDGDVYCYLQAENLTYHSTYDYDYLLRLKLLEKIKSCLKEVAFYWECLIWPSTLNLLISCWYHGQYYQWNTALAGVCHSLWGAGAAMGQCLSAAPWEQAGHEGGLHWLWLHHFRHSQLCR